MFFDHLIVKPATEAQVQESLFRNATHYGAKFGIPPERFVKLCTPLQKGAFADDGKLTTWVFVPEDDPDTTNFYVSCDVLAREVLILQPGQTSPSTCFGHVVTCVYVPPEHRGKGYATRFMSLMHSALAPHRYPNPSQTLKVTNRLSTVSVLYSAVGDYYSRCVPRAEESGWTLQASNSTTWTLSDFQISSANSSDVELEILSASDATATLKADDSHIPADLLELQRKDPSKSYFAFAPTAPLNEYSIVEGKVIRDLQGLSSPSWGAKIPGKADFMTWAHFFPPNLIVTRLRATAETFPVLLNAAVQAARDAEYEGLEIWNVPEYLVDIARKTGGKTARREEDLAAFKWYGQEPDTKVDNCDVVWAVNERYGWC